LQNERPGGGCGGANRLKEVKLGWRVVSGGKCPGGKERRDVGTIGREHKERLGKGGEAEGEKPESGWSKRKKKGMCGHNESGAH